MIADTLDIDASALLREVQKAQKISNEYSKEYDVDKIVKKDIPISEKAQKNLLSVFLVEGNGLSFEKIKQMIGDTEFTDETLINVKSTIDKLTCTVNNVKELTEKLYTTFSDNQEMQRVLTDLTVISETFQNLSDKDFINVIQENINKINQCQKLKEQEQIRNLYKSANDDEAEALKIQMQLRDRISKRLRIGENE